MEDKVPVALVTVTDAEAGIVGYTDSLGRICLPVNYRSLRFTHVSYENKELILSGSPADTVLQLQLRAGELNAVTVKSAVIPDRIYEEGNISRKTPERFILRQNILLGLKWTPAILPLYNYYLQSLKLKIDPKETVKKKDFTLELKVYALKADGTVGPSPLNHRPIYIRSSDLKKITVIPVPGNLRVPPTGLFFSLEFPALFDQNNDWKISFFADTDAETSSVYVLRNRDGSWPKEVLQAPGHRLPMGGFMSINHAVTFKKLLKAGD